MPHYNGWIDSELPPKEFMIDDTESQIQSFDNYDMILKVNHQLTNYNLVANYRFRLINLVLKNCVKGGHKIDISILNEYQEKINFNLKLTMFKRIEC